MNKSIINASNIVPAEVLRKIQLQTLKDLADSLINSFGPNGSTACIKKEKALNMYTKDGHNILKNIIYHGIIEQSIKDDIESITRHIVTTVGDGTTSAVILSYLIFDEITKSEILKSYHPADVLRNFNSVIEKIKKEIQSNSKEATIKDIYDIAKISSDGNEEVASQLKNIYSEFGMEVFIDVAISNAVESKLKIYDGMTLNTGFSDICYVNNTDNNSCIIRNPNIYFFEDPIDTKEMVSFFDAIILKNILYPLNDNNGNTELIPTVIIAPKLSRDLSVTLDSITTGFASAKNSQKPPMLIITDIHEYEQYSDLIKLCGAKSIIKYIDPEIQNNDIENGIAPTIENITEWCGSCDEVVSDSLKTKFINPRNMYDENGEYSTIYTTLLSHLNAELDKANSDGLDSNVKGKLKRRINSLKGNMVEYLVGGITMADRDSLRDLVEDAVKNTRSAALNGVGYAANFEAYIAIEKSSFNTELEEEIKNIILNAYTNLIETLYKNSINNDKWKSLFKISMFNKTPINLRTMEIESNDVKSSIESDMVILDTVTKIVGLMTMTNMFIVPTPMHNVYVDFK